MDKTVKRYFDLKKKQKEIEQELADLRGQILDHCAEQTAAELAVGRYLVKVVDQDRREYDDQKLYDALPDASVWRLLSRADTSKIAGLIKLNVLNEDVLKGTFTIKKVSSLSVERK